MFKKDIYSLIFISLFSVFFLNFIFQFISTNQLSDNFYKFTGFDYRYGSIFENLPILKYIIILFTNLGIYYFYRLFLNTTLSLFGTLFFFISPLNLYNLTQSIGRDYIRIVFIVFLLSALIQLYKKHKYLFVYLIQIVSLGLGLVFRKDFFILMILIIICYQYIIFNSDNLKEDFKKFNLNLFLVIFFSICIYLLAPIPLFTDLSRGAHSFLSGMSSRYSITFGEYYSNLVFFNNSNDRFIGITSFIFADIKKFNTSDINAFSYTLIFALNYILIDFLNLLNKCIFALFNSLSFSFQYWSYKVFMLNEDINTIIKTIFFILSKISYIFIIIFVYINYRNNKNYFGYILLIFFFLICYPVLQYQIRHFVYLQFIMFLPFLFSMEYLYKKFVQK